LADDYETILTPSKTIVVGDGDRVDDLLDFAMVGLSQMYGLEFLGLLNMRPTDIPMKPNARALVWCELRELYSQDEARRWMMSPHPQLNDRRPLDCSYADVMAVIDQLKAGAFT
jgi:hypothetical protein